MTPEQLHRRVSDIHNEVANFLVWGLTLIVVALAVINFQALHHAGALEAAAVERLGLALNMMVGAAVLGFALYFIALFAGLRAESNAGGEP